MIAISAANLRKFAARIKAFGCDTVELSAPGPVGVLTARVATSTMDATIQSGDGGHLLPSVVNVTDLCRVAAVLSGELQIERGRSGLDLASLVGCVTLAPREAIRPRRDMQIETTATDSVTFAAAFDRVAYSAASDINRYGLNGLMIEAVTGGGRMVATDGNRLAYAAAPGLPAEVCLRDGYMLPRWLFPSLASEVREAARLAIGLHYESPTRAHEKRGAGWIRVVTDSATITGPLTLAEFPAYREVLPKSAPACCVVVDRDAAIKAIKAAALFGARTHTTAGRATTLTTTITDGVVTFSATTKGEGSTHAVVPAGVTGAAPVIGLAHRLILDALTHLPRGPVEMSVGTALGPVLLRTLTARDSGLAIVMPVRLD